jgi:hypothetical protein
MPGASLEDVRLQIEAFVAETEGRVSVALLPLEAGPIFELNPEEHFSLASLAKLYILVAYLAGLERQELDLTEDELFLVEFMITISDNYSADLLWESIGANEGLQAYLEAQELAVPLFNEGADWGTIGSTAGEIALLLQGLDAGRLVSEGHRDLAFDLLSRVVSDQRWGVSAGTDDATMVWLNNGWYPDEYRWRVNSAGLVRSDDGSQAYVLVILTDGQPHEYGIETIETIAALINRALLPPAPDPELLVQSFEDGPGFGTVSPGSVEAMNDAPAEESAPFDIAEGQT